MAREKEAGYGRGKASAMRHALFPQISSSHAATRASPLSVFRIFFHANPAATYCTRGASPSRYGQRSQGGLALLKKDNAKKSERLQELEQDVIFFSLCVRVWLQA